MTSSCINSVYDIDGATFQSSVTLPSGTMNGGEILGGYDASVNKLIFSYVNPCDSSTEDNIWTSANGVAKTPLDDCNGNSKIVKCLTPSSPSADYKDFVITQMVVHFGYFGFSINNNPLIVSCGYFKDSSDSDKKVGFIYVFDVITGETYTNFGTSGWYIKSATYDIEINTIYSGNEPYCNDTIIMYGGYENDSNGEKQQLLDIVYQNQDNTTTTINPVISPAFSPSSIDTVNVECIYRIQNQPEYIIHERYAIIFSNKNDNNHMKIYVRVLELKNGTPDVAQWVGNTFEINLPHSFSGINDSDMKYLSSCIEPGNYLIQVDDIIYIGFQYTQSTPNTYSTNMIAPVAIDAPYQGTDTKIQIYSTEKNYFTNLAQPVPYDGITKTPLSSGHIEFNGILVLDPTIFTQDTLIQNMDFYSKSHLANYGVTQSDLFLDITRSPSGGPTTKYVAFIKSGIATSSTSASRLGYDDYTLVKAITANYSTSDSITLTSILSTSTISTRKGIVHMTQVTLDGKLSGTMNDLQFKLFACPKQLQLFAFGNYVNSPAQPAHSFLIVANAISNICLSKGTQILCDQGIINIERINTNKHTINNRTINHITQGIHTDNYLIKIKQSCLSSNSPSSDIICSGDHKILYKNNLVEAKNLVDKIYGVGKIKNDKRVLYNILMDKHEVIMANNTPVESLHPQNIVALLYNNYNNPQAREFLSDKICQMNRYNKNININKKNNMVLI